MLFATESQSFPSECDWIYSKQIFKGCAHLFGVLPPVKQVYNSDL